jgi:hypothetical protein
LSIIVRLAAITKITTTAQATVVLSWLGRQRRTAVAANLAADEIVRLDARRAFIDRGDARVAKSLRRAGFLDVAHSTVHLDAEARNLAPDIGAPGLHKRSQNVRTKPGLTVTQRIPIQLYEAAELDGAGAWARLRHVTLPQLIPTFVFVGIITAIGFFQLFAEPYVMTQGGPLKSTLSMVLYMYEEGFRWWRLGSAAAIAFVLFALVFVITLVQLKLQRERPT